MKKLPNLEKEACPCEEGAAAMMGTIRRAATGNWGSSLTGGRHLCEQLRPRSEATRGREDGAF